MLAACILAWVGFSKSVKGAFDAVFKATAFIWFLYIIFVELLNFHFENLPQILYLCILGAAFIYALLLIKMPEIPLVTALLNTLIIIIGLYAAWLSWADVSLWMIMISGQIIFSLLAFFTDKSVHDGQRPGITRSLLPLIIFPWAFAVAKTMDGPMYFIAACFIVGSAIFASIQAQIFCPKDRLWSYTLSPVGFVIFGGGLLYTTLLHIQPGFWPVMLDGLLLVYVLISCRWMIVTKNKDASFFGLFCLITTITFMQSVLLRVFGSENKAYMTFMDLWTMRLPALVSLSWVIIGASLCVYSNRKQSRSLWSSGALLLGVATLKLVIFDFGSLDQLGNIIAMILSGAVFMGLAWFVPIPPKVKPLMVEKTAASTKPSFVFRRNRGDSRQWVWVVTVIAILFLVHHCSNPVSYDYKSSIRGYQNSTEGVLSR